MDLERKECAEGERRGKQADFVKGRGRKKGRRGTIDHRNVQGEEAEIAKGEGAAGRALKRKETGHRYQPQIDAFTREVAGEAVGALLYNDILTLEKFIRKNHWSFRERGSR